HPEVHLSSRRHAAPSAAAVPGRYLTVDALRALPSVHQLLEEEPATTLIAAHGRPLVRFAVQRVLEEERRRAATNTSHARWARGELVEIGGGFRMPEVMRLSGARMVEVGTTNRTRAEDYAAAVTPKTVAIMKVHASNFQVVGFTESVELKPLAAIARQHQLLL